jgi:hypothetical protein
LAKSESGKKACTCSSNGECHNQPRSSKTSGRRCGCGSRSRRRKMTLEEQPRVPDVLKALRAVLVQRRRQQQSD